MTITRFFGSLTLLCGLLTICLSSLAQTNIACSRGCLENFIDQYLSALIKQSSGILPLSSSVKFTENGQRLELGDGLWNTVTGAGSYKLVLADVEVGQVAFMGTIEEAMTPTIFVLRLKVVDKIITEIETLVIRNQISAENLNKISSPRQSLLSSVPITERHSRNELASIANQYFSGIELNDGKGDYPFWDDCTRLENGYISAGNPSAIPGSVTMRNSPLMTCEQQFKLGLFYYVTSIRDRRFLIIDPERGLAFAFAFFDNASGDAKFGTLADGSEVESGPSIPWTWQIAEVFKIEGGKIGPVESVLHQVPYKMGSGWSTWEDAMSSRARW